MVTGSPRTGADLSAVDARRALLRAQGLLGGAAAWRRGGPRSVLERLGAVQLDTISVVARSHELVHHARLGPVPRPAVEAALWGGGAFEYWSHAACVLPIGLWPWFAFRRREYARRGHWRDAFDPVARAEVRRELAERGPLTAADLGGAQRGGEWWDWSPLKREVERMLAAGEVVCVTRAGWRRVYDLAERAVPAALRAAEPDDEACWAALVQHAGERLGVATVADLADHHRLRAREVRAVLERTSLVPVTVAGWRDPAWAHPAALDAIGAGGRHRTTLLSPFDSLVWDRGRTERVFGFRHRLEAYTPRERREHGYFVMPLLAGGRLVGRVDPAREGRTLVARKLSVEPRAVAAMADALGEAATWVGCDAVRIDAVVPAEAAAAVRAALERGPGAAPSE